MGRFQVENNKLFINYNLQVIHGQTVALETQSFRQGFQFSPTNNYIINCLGTEYRGLNSVVQR